MEREQLRSAAQSSDAVAHAKARREQAARDQRSATAEDHKLQIQANRAAKAEAEEAERERMRSAAQAARGTTMGSVDRRQQQRAQAGSRAANRTEEIMATKQARAAHAQGGAESRNPPHAHAARTS